MKLVVRSRMLLVVCVTLGWASASAVMVSPAPGVVARGLQQEPDGPNEVLVALPDDGFDMALDEARQRLYVSIPDLGKVIVISTASYEIVDEFNVGSTPQGIDLSIDGGRLFVALRGHGGVAVVDLEGGPNEFIDILAELGDNRTYDVVEAQPDRLFVTANPSSSGFAWVVMVKLDQGNTAQRAASNRIIRARPVLEKSSDQRFLYIGVGFSPNSLYKLDLTQPNAPIILEDQHGSVSGTDHLEVSPDGTRIYLASGQVLRTGSFIQTGTVGFGVAQFGESGDIIYVVDEPNQLTVYETQTFTLVDQISLPCSFRSIRRMILLPEDSGWLVLGDDAVCGRLAGDLCSTPPTEPTNPTPVNGALDISVGALLTWEGGEADCVVRFDVYFGTENPPVGLLCENVARRYCAPGPLDPLTTYNWQVVAKNDQGSALGSVWSFTTNDCAEPTLQEDLEVELGGLVFDMALDEQRQRLYVSIPALGKVIAISTVSYEVEDEFNVGSTPQGIDLSLDGTRLFIALRGEGGVSVVDLETGTSDLIDVLAELGDDRTYDVVEAQPDRLFVTANPSGNGFAWVVMVKLDQGNIAQRVGSNRIIRARPVLEKSPDQRFLYIGEGFSPNSLYKLDLTQPNVPIILEDQHGSVSGTDHLEVSPDGDRIFLGSGQVLSTATFDQVGSLGDGVPQFGDNGEEVFVADEPDVIEVYQANTYQLVDVLTVACSFNRIERLIVLPQGGGHLVLGDDLLCFYGIPATPSAAVDPLPEHAAQCRPLDTDLSWRSGDLGCVFTQYDVYFDVTNPPTAMICADTTSTFCDPGPLESATTYYWQVVAKNRGGTSPGAVWSFTTEGLELVLNLDIKPGSCPNSYNRGSHGMLPVGLLGTAEFDVTTVNLASIGLSRADGIGGTVAPHEGPPGPHSTIEDVGTPFAGQPCDCHNLAGDGIDDLAMKFRTDDLVSVLQLNSLPAGALVELVVRGELDNGCEFIATDCVRLVPADRGNSEAFDSERSPSAAESSERTPFGSAGQTESETANRGPASDSVDTVPAGCGAVPLGLLSAMLAGMWLFRFGAGESARQRWGSRRR